MLRYRVSRKNDSGSSVSEKRPYMLHKMGWSLEQRQRIASNKIGSGYFREFEKLALKNL